MSGSQIQYALDWTARRPPEVQAKIEKGMSDAEAHANPFWKVVLSGCILAVARRQAELSVDDILQMAANINTRVILQRAQDAVLRQLEVSKKELVDDLFGEIRYERVR